MAMTLFIVLKYNLMSSVFCEFLWNKGEDKGFF